MSDDAYCVCGYPSVDKCAGYEHDSESHSGECYSCGHTQRCHEEQAKGVKARLAGGR
jgi:hypothetical protein